MNLMMLCAGSGTRLRPSTDILPKPAIPFLNVPLASFFLEWSREMAFQRFCVNTHHLHSRIEQLFREWPVPLPELIFSKESRLLGSGGGLGQFAPVLSGRGPVLLMNGDEVFFPSRTGQLREAFNRHNAEKNLATLLVSRHPGVGTQFGGVWLDADGKVLGFSKTPWAGADLGFHYIGAIWFDSRIFQYLPGDRESNILYDDLTRAMKDGEKVAVHEISGFWHESGNPLDYLLATEAALKILDSSTPEAKFLSNTLDRLSPGWTLSSRDGAPVLLGSGSVLPESCHVERFAVIAPQISIPATVRLKAAVVAPQRQIPLSGDLSGLIL